MRFEETRWTATVLLSIAVGLAYGYSGGPPDGMTGGPGEDTCVMCHTSFGLNSGPGVLTISGPPSYEAGQTYPVTVSLQHAGQTRWGFEFSPLDQGACGITDPANTQASVSGGRSYVTHTAAGTYSGTPGPASWTFNWTAPAEPPSSITFYAAGNAANSDGSPEGDYIYTATHSMGLVPVELLRFGAAFEGGVVVLRWTTLSECDNAGFRIYRSCMDETSLISPRLIPGAGTSPVPHDYRFTDPDVRPGNQYAYRLMDVSSTGRETASGRTSVTIPRPERTLDVTPTVIHGQTAMLIRADGYEDVEIIDVAGRMVRHFVAPNTGSPTTWDLRDGNGRRIPPAMYVCRASFGDDVAVEPFVVVK
ncbi:MAG: hypothetical protein MUE60_02975 [Candidatus Eisenbacteria bacterium]|jgi:hypothetical protein|nr:hypothetical protein [Candidatus Eisenbacteria bacterium]